jgi:hypothetical protein
MTAKSCLACAFFAIHANGLKVEDIPPELLARHPAWRGECRRHAPRPGRAHDPFCRWKWVGGDQWCGEYQRREGGDA